MLHATLLDHGATCCAVFGQMNATCCNILTTFVGEWPGYDILTQAPAYNAMFSHNTFDKQSSFRVIVGYQNQGKNIAEDRGCKRYLQLV